MCDEQIINIRYEDFRLRDFGTSEPNGTRLSESPSDFWRLVGFGMRPPILPGRLNGTCHPIEIRLKTHEIKAIARGFQVEFVFADCDHGILCNRFNWLG